LGRSTGLDPDPVKTAVVVCTHHKAAAVFL
jgi:hypothetical protein